jgi:hypothetical protein
LCLMSPVSLDCPFLIAPLVFSDINKQIIGLSLVKTN